MRVSIELKSGRTRKVKNLNIKSPTKLRTRQRYKIVTKRTELETRVEKLETGNATNAIKNLFRKTKKRDKGKNFI